MQLAMVCKADPGHGNEAARSFHPPRSSIVHHACLLNSIDTSCAAVCKCRLDQAMLAGAEFPGGRGPRRVLCGVGLHLLSHDRPHLPQTPPAHEVVPGAALPAPARPRSLPLGLDRPQDALPFHDSPDDQRPR